MEEVPGPPPPIGEKCLRRLRTPSFSTAMDAQPAPSKEAADEDPINGPNHCFMQLAKKLSMATTVEAVLGIKAAQDSRRTHSSTRDPGISLHDDQLPIPMSTYKLGDTRNQPQL